MNEDYLWDKSGQPDPQIQELEEILGTLRYQPKPLVIPRDFAVSRRRSYFPLLAIAATVLLALLAGGVWVKVRTTSKSQPQRAAAVPAAVDEKGRSEDLATANPTPTAIKETPRISNVRRRRKPSVINEPEREEALAAKEQLMVALRLASEKLNLAHRKTQSPIPAQIKNQHRIG